MSTGVARHVVLKCMGTCVHVEVDSFQARALARYIYGPTYICRYAYSCVCMWGLLLSASDFHEDGTNGRTSWEASVAFGLHAQRQRDKEEERRTLPQLQWHGNTFEREFLSRNTRLSSSPLIDMPRATRDPAGCLSTDKS